MSFSLSNLCDNELMFAETAIFTFVYCCFFSFVYLFVGLIFLKSLFVCFVIIASLFSMRIRRVHMHVIKYIKGPAEISIPQFWYMGLNNDP